LSSFAAVSHKTVVDRRKPLSKFTAGNTARGYIFMRKNKLFIMGTLAATLAFGLVLFGGEDDSSEDSDHTKITITGIPAEFNASGENAYIKLFSDINESNFENSTLVTAGEGTISGISLTVSLKKINSSNGQISFSNEDWTGRGEYYLLADIKNGPFL
jgi:hypothetical protein